MMSGKAPPAHITIPTRSFYTESPPKKSKLQDNNNIRPPFRTFKDQLVNFDRKLSEPTTTSPGPKEPEQVPTSASPTPPSTVTITSTQTTDHDVESKSLDRDSPIPLKNLGNTCYENSIIQCLFSLDMFMDNFENSMQRMRDYVVKSKSGAEDQTNIDVDFDVEKQQLDDFHDEATVAKEPSITEDDVRFRIANAFDNLYKCYTKRRIQAEALTSDKTDPACKADDDNFPKLPDPEQPQPSENSKSTQPLPSYQPFTEAESTVQASSTPIALVEPISSSNEPSEIETRLEELKSAVGERSSQFNSAHQQDASEFFYHVIDSIQEFYQSLNRNNVEDNPVTKAFELELDYLIKCPKCHHKSISESEKIRTLPLPLPHVQNESVNNGSDNFSDEINRIPTPPTSDLGLDSPESSSVSDDTRTNSEEKENQALSNDATGSNHLNVNNETNTMSISKLELADKSYRSDNQKAQSKKNYTLSDALNNYFKDDVLECGCSQPGCDSKQRTKKCLLRKLPQILFITLARYSYTGKKNLDEIEAPFELAVPFLENISPSHSNQHKQFSDDDNTYQLVAVVCHLGSSLNAGHYTSYVYNQNNFSWYSCDDDSIVKVHEDEVKNNASKSGYCFFYAHRSCIARKPQPQVHPVSQEMDQQQENDAIVRGTYMIDSSTILTPESSPSPISLIQEDSGFNSDVVILTGSEGTSVNGKQESC